MLRVVGRVSDDVVVIGGVENCKFMKASLIWVVGELIGSDACDDDVSAGNVDSKLSTIY